MSSHNAPRGFTEIEYFKIWFIFISSPRPGVAKPEGWQHMNLGWFGPPVADRDSDQDVLWICLGVLDEDVEVAVFIEDAGVKQLKLSGPLVSRPIGIDEGLVGVLGLGVLVEVLHV